MLPAALSLLLSTALAESDPEIYSRAIDLIEDRYLWVDELDAVDALELAAEAAEDAVPWLIVETSDGEIVLSHGTSGEFSRVKLSAGDLSDVTTALMFLENSIRSGPGEIPEEVDLSVELLRGVSRAMDRHSVVMYRGRLARFDERIKGRLTGVGSRIGEEDGELVVREVFPDGPAYRGGLLNGDVILEIDGFSTVGLSTDQSISRIRGAEGSPVVLTVRRDDGDSTEILPLSFVREVVRIPNVSWERTDSGVGIIRIENFSEQTVRWMRQALTEFRDAGELTGVIVDLRGNTGGSMLQACRSVDLFLTEGLILTTEGRGGAEVRNLLRRYPARVEGDEVEVGVVLLVDDRSASASEILAGALALQERAVMIGERTHGKGTVQMRHELRSGDRDTRVEMKLTVAEYKLGEDRTAILAGEGLEPDLWVLPTTFSRGGVSLPDHLIETASTPVLTYVNERTGWRDGEALERGDYLETFAERALLSAQGADRTAMLAAIDNLLPVASQEEEALMVQTFGWRTLDWSPASIPGGIPNVEVSVVVVDPPRAGEKVEVRAEVRNLGTTPLNRLRIRLDAEDSRLPWEGLTLPIGALAPGEVGLGSAMVTLPMSTVSRVDQVHVDVYADAHPPVASDSVRLSIEARTATPMAASGALIRSGNDARISLTLENHGIEDLANIRARIALPDEATIELLSREVALEALSAGGSGSVDIGVVLPEGPIEDLSLELRVDVEGRGEVLRVPLSIPESGDTVRMQPPTLATTLPTEADAGHHEIGISAADDGGIASVTVWWDFEKIAWLQGQGSTAELLTDVEIGGGHHTLTVEVIDDQGATTTRRYHVQGRNADGAADEH
ncbi:MAG: carboxyl-terminal processing protease [Myxococcota bacterium]|jgi:carboxyl-terminal processing protease